MSTTMLFGERAPEAVKSLIASWPDEIERNDQRKGEKYWQYFDRKRAAFDGTFSLGVSGLPGEPGAQYIAVTFAPGGDVSAVRVVSRDEAIASSKIAMEAKLDDWVAIVEGYDIGKAMTYHMLPLTKGGSLDLLQCVYFLHELLTIMTRVDTSARLAAA